MNKKRLIVIIVETLAGLMGAMSAYGGSCPAFSPARILETEPDEILEASSIALNAVMVQYQMIFIIMNILTYVAAIGTFIMIVALIMKKGWFYNMALGTAILGSVSGWIPYFLVTSGGAGTPSNMRAILYLVVVLILIIPGFRKELKDNIAKVDPADSSSVKENLPAIIFFPGLLLWLQSYLVAPSHMLGNNVDMFQSLQIGMGLLIVAFGILSYTITKYKSLQIA
ncbi:MAG: hypothetical protein GY870_08870 [archaeon]|nr:hypothetical protein [archaeon]